MGTGASAKGPRQSVVLAVSPRVAYAQKTGDKGCLDSPALLDLGHGTVRYRQATQNENKKTVASQSDTRGDRECKEKVKTGYFYHAKINNFSQVEPEENFKTFYVAKGPKSERSKLFYVYGKGFGGEPDQGLRTTPYRPQGVGYKWPASFENLSFSVTVRADQEPLGDDSDPDDDLSTTNSEQIDEHLEVAVRDTDTVLDLKQKLSQRFLRGTDKIELTSDRKVLADDTLMHRLKPKKAGLWNRFHVQLTLSYH